MSRLSVIAIGKRGGKIVAYDSKGQPVYQGSEAAKKLEAERAKEAVKPVIPDKREGLPIKVGNVIITALGGEVPRNAKWKAGYPGPGFAGKANYKGKNYTFKFVELGNRLGVELTLPDGTKEKFDSPNQASDAMALYARGLDMRMSSTEKKEKGISYPAKKAFGVHAARKQIAVVEAVNVKDMTAAQLKASGLIPKDAEAVKEPKSRVGRRKDPVDPRTGKPLTTPITVKKGDLGDVTLTPLGEGQYEISYQDPKTKETITEAMRSLSSACDLIWLRQRGYEDANEYKKKNNVNKIPSGGGWGFWGLKPSRVKHLTPEKLHNDKSPVPVPDIGPVQKVKEPLPSTEEKPPITVEPSDPTPPAEPKPKEKSPDGWDRMPEVEREAPPAQRPKDVDNTKVKKDLGELAVEITERYEPDMAVARFKVIGEQLYYIQVSNPKEADRAGLSRWDMGQWDVLQGQELSALELRVFFKKYRRQIIAGWGEEEYIKLGLADLVPGWDTVEDEEEPGERVTEENISDEEKERLRLLNKTHPGRFTGKGALVVMGPPDTPLKEGDVIKVIHPKTGGVVDYKIDGFGKSFRRGKDWACYYYLAPSDRSAPECIEADQWSIDKPADERRAKALEKKWPLSVAGGGRLVIKMPLTSEVDVGDFVDAQSTQDEFGSVIEAGRWEITSFGRDFEDKSTGTRIRYAYVARADNNATAKKPQEETPTESALRAIRQGKAPKTVVVLRDEYGQYRLYAAYDQKYNELVSNKNGNISGITEYVPGNDDPHKAASRVTHDIELVDEIIQKAKDNLGMEIFEDESVQKGRAELAAHREALRQPIPEVQSILAPGFSLYPYQNEAVKFLDKTGGNALVGDEMGLGKTLETLAWGAKEKKKVLVVCPKVVRRTWIQEAQKFFPDYFKGRELDTKDLKTLTPADLADVNVATINYESLHKFEDLVGAAGFDMLVVDESHRMKDPKARQTKAIRRVGKQMKHRVLLSGTAIKNKKHELFTQLDLVKPGLFSSASAIKSETIGGLWNKMQTCYIARQKAKVLTDLPEKISQIVGDNFEGLPPLPSEALTIGELSAYKTRLAVAKLPFTEQLVKETLLSSDENVIVFTESVATAKELAERLGDVALLHHGELKHDHREAIKEEFQKPDSPKRVFVTTRQSMAVGATLTRASQIVFNDLPWTAADIRQAEDRAHRVGQERNVHVRWVTAENNAVDQNIAETIMKKYNLASKVNAGHQLSAEEREWMEKPVSLEEALRGVHGQDAPVIQDRSVAYKPQSPPGWERFMVPDLVWKTKKRIAKTTYQSLETGDAIRVSLEVPGGARKLLVYEKIGDDQWALREKEGNEGTAQSDSETDQAIRHWLKTGAKVEVLDRKIQTRGKASLGVPDRKRSILVGNKVLAWQDILDEVGIDDHDYATYDQTFRAWHEKGRKGSKPVAFPGGELDAINEELGRKVSGPLEGFISLLAKRSKRPTWRDVEAVLAVFRDVPGFEKIRVPGYANDLIVEAEAAKELARLEAEHAAAPLPDETTEEMPDWEDVPIEAYAGLADAEEEEEQPERLTGEGSLDEEAPLHTGEAEAGWNTLTYALSEDGFDRMPAGTQIRSRFDADAESMAVKGSDGKWWKVTLRIDGSVAEEDQRDAAGMAELINSYLEYDFPVWISDAGMGALTPEEVDLKPELEAEIAEETTVLVEAEAPDDPEDDPEPETPPPPQPKKLWPNYRDEDAKHGDEYHYGARNRPVSFANVPKGAKHHDHAGYRHGIAAYEAPLTEEMIRSFELEPILNSEGVKRRIDAVKAEMSGYPRYLKLLAKDREAVERIIKQKLADQDPRAYFDLDRATAEIISWLEENKPKPNEPTPEKIPVITEKEREQVKKGQALLDVNAALEGEERIAPVGEHLWGSRKDLAEVRITSSEQLKGLSFADASVLVKKSNLIDIPDLEVLEAQGMTPGTAHVILRILADIAKAPEDTAQARAAYVDELREVYTSLMACKDLAELDSVTTSMRRKRDADHSVSFSDMFIMPEDSWNAGLTPQEEKSIRANKDRLLANLQSHARKLEAKYPGYRFPIKERGRGSGRWAMSRERIKPYDSLGAGFERAVLRGPLGYSTFRAGSQSSKAIMEAMSLARTLDQEPETGWTLLRGYREVKKAEKKKGAPKTKRINWHALVAPKVEARRKGGKHQATQTTAEDTQALFNLREIDFGREAYMTQADRAYHLLSTETALADMADILEIDRRLVSFQGRLGIALGADGQGGAAKAHYETGRKMINITRDRGAGSLAHEWGHALDNIIGQVYGQEDPAGRGSVFATEYPDELPSDLKKAVLGIQAAMTTSEPTPQQKEDRRKARTAVEERIRELIRSNNGIVYKIRGLMGKAKPESAEATIAAREKTVKEWSEKLKGLEAKYGKAKRIPQKALEDMVSLEHWVKVGKQEIAGMRDGSLIRTADDEKEIVRLKEEVNNITRQLNAEKRKKKLIPHPDDRVSDYLLSARTMGAYWEDGAELWARAFASYVEDRLAANDQKNTYLVSGTKRPIDSGVDAPGLISVQPYPQGVERERINAQFDSLFEILKKQDYLSKAIASLRKPRFVITK